MSWTQEKTNKPVEQNRILGWGGGDDIEPNLKYDKCSTYNQREDEELFSILEREDKRALQRHSGERTCMVHLLKQELPMTGEEEYGQ